LVRNARPVHRWFWLLLILGFMPGLIGIVSAEWQPPDKQPPTDADLVMVGGQSNTLAIRLLNLSPYQITSEFPPQLAEYTDMDRCSHKSFLFVPLRIPKFIPGLSPHSADQSWAGPGNYSAGRWATPRESAFREGGAPLDA
jgi:hypothetical protein